MNSKNIFIAVALLIAGVIIGLGLSSIDTESNSQNIEVEEEVVQNQEDQANDQEEHAEDEHDYTVEVEGSAMKALTVVEVAELWEIDPELLLEDIVQEFDLQEEYTIETTLEEIREREYKFSPSIIKDLAEALKTENASL